ncbi:MAG TPA: hypothetical protein DCM40_05240 [Maribacter sp.]|jgi:hypothetical protein|nr:hypothetical protein [Maribacter sp.]|tara:strand:+ start:1337 stop:1570 length:234 start_codon:yes stop_codon:yes gene_type:complete
MEVLNKIKQWAGALADVGISVAALAIVVEVLGLGNMPFMPQGLSVVENVSSMLSTLGSHGIMGLIAVWVLWGIWNRK